EGFPLSDARLVPQGDQVDLYLLRHRLQYRHRLARGQDLSLRASGKQRGELLLDVRPGPFELQVDWAGRPADQAEGQPRQGQTRAPTEHVGCRPERDRSEAGRSSPRL